MDVETAVSTLRASLGDGSDDPISLAWQAVDRAMSRAGALPSQWERMTSSAAAAHVGMTQSRWATETSQGRAPGADGTDGSGRQVWAVATLDRFKAGEWESDGRPPPLEGPGCTIQAWRRWAKAQGIRVRPSAGPGEIHGLAVRLGVLAANSA